MSRKRRPIKANRVMISKIMPQTNQLESTNGVSSREPESHFIDVLNTKAGSDCCGTQQNGRGSDVRILLIPVSNKERTYSRPPCYVNGVKATATLSLPSSKLPYEALPSTFISNKSRPSKTSRRSSLLG